MTVGTIIELVRSFGSRWGHIQPIGTSRAVFFNQTGLPEGADFNALREGQVVQFDEEPDRANGTHAVRIILGEVPRRTKVEATSRNHALARETEAR